MNLDELADNLQKFEKKYPPTSFWPKNIKLPKKAWREIKKIQKKTSKKQKEFSFNVVNVDGDLIYTTSQRGNSKNVTSNQRFKLKFKQIDPKIIEKQIYLNDLIFRKRRIKVKDFDSKHKPFIYPVFNVHSHPTFRKDIYSFFSATDLDSFLKSNSLLMGLVTDVFWLVAKTKDIIKNFNQDKLRKYNKISRLVFENSKSIDKIIIEELTDWGMIFYKGNLNKLLINLNYELE